MGLRVIVMILIGLAGTGVSLVRPYGGLLMLGVLYFFRPDLYGYEQVVTPVKWLTVAMLIGYVAHRGREAVFAGAGWMALILLAYVVATIFAPNTNADSWDRLLLIAKILVVVFLIEKLCDTPHKLAGFVAAILIGASYFVKVSFFAWRGAAFGDVRVESEIGQGGGSNYVAWALAATVGFLYYKAMRGKGWQRVLALTAIPFWVIAIMATGSRGGLLCLIAASGVFLLQMRKFKLLLAGALAVYLFFCFAPAAYMERMGTITLDPQKMDSSALARWQNIEIGKKIIRDYPIFGSGLETFPRIKKQYLPPDYIGASYHVAHNTFIQMGAELGVPFLLMFLCVTALGAARLARRGPPMPSQQDQDDLDWVRVGTLAAMAATWMEMAKGDIAHMDFFWWIYGLAYTCHHVRRKMELQAAAKPAERPRRKSAFSPAALAPAGET